MFQNIELNAAHHLHFLVETLWSPKTMSLIKFPKVWVSMTTIIFCLCILWKACITWHFWGTNRKLTFSWKITPLGAIPPLKSATDQGPISLTIFADNSNSMEILSCCNSVAGHQIATKFCTCHDSIAVMQCTKFGSDHHIRIEVRVKQSFHRIWIAMEKPLVKRGPVVTSRHSHTTIYRTKTTICIRKRFNKYQQDHKNSATFPYRLTVYNLFKLNVVRNSINIKHVISTNAIQG